MGCDIHLYVEKRNTEGKWESVDTWEKEEDDEVLRVPYGKSFYDCRNYDLFAILADVRNGRGFAGVKLGDGFNPIADPRGLPDDVSENVKALSDSWDCDGHSHSHFTVAELIAFDWTQETNHQGFADFGTFVKWSRWDRKNGESPESYCGGTSQPTITLEEGDKLLEQMNERIEACGNDHRARAKAEEDFINERGNLAVECHWRQPYFASVRHFLSDTMPRLWKVGKPEDVRIVFWFDN
jgi:hypothetical protein